VIGAPEPVLAHDYLLILRGAERTFAAMADLWPGSTVHTLLYDEEGTQGRFKAHPVRPSPLQRLPVRQDGFRRLLPLFPLVAARLPTEGASLLVSSSSAFIHAAPRADDAAHVCYCHSPFRYIWHEAERARQELPRAARGAFRPVAAGLRGLDRKAVDRVTRLVANAEVTRERIARFWGREADVVYPPVEVERFHIGEPQDYLLTVGELVRHKRTAFALSAARQAGARVKVVGSGPERARLEAEFGDVAEFLGRVDGDRLVELCAGARAFLQPNVEEFGIAAVEAQAAGRPVVAAAAGGALETVRDGETGVLVAEGDADAYAEALRYTDFDRFDPQRIVRHAATFSVEAFGRGLRDQVELGWAQRSR